MKGKRHITTGKYPNLFFFPSLFTGCKIQAGSSACGRCCHWRRGGGSHWAPRGLQSGRNCSCTWWWDFGLHRWKIDPEEKTKTDWAGLFQLPGAFLPKSQKIQLKHRSVTTRDRSAVAVLMTDLQPHALNTRLGCVNVCEILPAVLLMGVGGNGNARTLELPLFRCDKLHQSFKNYLVTSFNYGILRWATCPAGVLEGRCLVLSCTKRPSDSTEGETWKTWVLSHERHNQFFPFSFIFVLICELPMCSKQHPLRTALGEYSSSMALQLLGTPQEHCRRGEVPNPNHAEPETSACCSSAPGWLLPSNLRAWHQQHSAGRVKWLHGEAVLQQGPLPQ